MLRYNELVMARVAEIVPTDAVLMSDAVLFASMDEDAVGDDSWECVALFSSCVDVADGEPVTVKAATEGVAEPVEVRSSESVMVPSREAVGEASRESVALTSGEDVIDGEDVGDGETDAVGAVEGVTELVVVPAGADTDAVGVAV